MNILSLCYYLMIVQIFAVINSFKWQETTLLYGCGNLKKYLDEMIQIS